ncbi:MAG: hypothetical protein K940chlam3_01132 [Chlamydiae bacterium]|nr:hypothetical protein [Chlamydiota bacterium]
MIKHVVFYDGTCGLCDRIVLCIHRSDKKRIFGFAPLEGKTAAEQLKDLPPEQKSADSMVLIENYQTPDQRTLIMGKAGLRTSWLLGGWWSLLGIFYFCVPAFVTDFFYRIVARNRHIFFNQKECIIPPAVDRDLFLD